MTPSFLVIAIHVHRPAVTRALCDCQGYGGRVGFLGGPACEIREDGMR